MKVFVLLAIIGVAMAIRCEVGASGNGASILTDTDCSALKSEKCKSYTKTAGGAEFKEHTCGECESDEEDCEDCATDLCNGAGFKSYIVLPLIVVSAWLMF